MKRFSWVTFFLLLFASNAFGWGQKGHDTVAAIAERHLTPAAKSAIDSLLEGRSIVYWANWLDNASHTKPYAYTKTWHYKNIDANETYDDAQANPAGDAVTAVKAQIETLAGGSAKPDDRRLALKILIHVIGDLHQPLHVGHATDLGGNRVKVKFFGRDTNLHTVWDTRILESGHNWSYSEWADQLDILSPDEVRAVEAGSVDDWARETLPIAGSIYEEFPDGCAISYNEVFEWTPVVEHQLLRAGLRLARTLNALFDPAEAPASPWSPAR